MSPVERSLYEAGSALVATLKANKVVLFSALPRRELSILVADLHRWNYAAQGIEAGTATDSEAGVAEGESPSDAQTPQEPTHDL